MKIVHIEDFFHPDAGYQVNILSKYMAALGHEVYVITSEMDKMPSYLTSFFGKENLPEKDERFEKKYGVKIIRIPLKRYISGRSVYSGVIFKTVENIKPDILYVHGNDTLIGIQYIMRNRKCDFPIISDSHMLEMASANRFKKAFRWVYSHVVAKRIIKDRITVIRVQDNPYVEKCLGIPLTQCPWISFGSDLMLFNRKTELKELFRKENGIDEKDRIFLYAGKLDEAKGGAILADAIKEHIEGANGGRAVFVIVGNTVGEYGQKVEKTFSESGNRIFRYPTQKYADLAQYYQVADVAVFPRQCSLSFYDVQACGLPVIVEDNEINIERTTHDNGSTFKAESSNALRNEIEKFLNLPEAEFNRISENSERFIKENYDYMNITKEYISVIEKAIERYREGKH